MRYLNVIHGNDYYKLNVEESLVPHNVKENDILIKVAATGVNRADIYQAEGSYNPPSGVTDILGLEVSGEVVEIGKSVTMHEVGDKVCALLRGGGYADYVTVAEWRALPIPKRMDLVFASAIPEVFATVYLNIFELARLKPMETILIHGGSSGIGTAAIQLAKAFGSKVFVTAGDKEKCKFCEELGADKAINYKTEDFVSVVKALNDGKGVDVILDMVGGDYFQKNLKALRVKGRLVCIAFLHGARVEMNFAPLLLKNLTIIGSTLRSRSEKTVHELMQSLRTVVWPLFESGAVNPVIDSVFDFEDADTAHARMRGFEHMGKIILRTT